MKQEILEKILRQSQLIGVKALIENSNIEKKVKIAEKIDEIYSWNEVLWESYYQETKRNIALELKIMTLEKEKTDLSTEVSKLSKTLLNEL